MFAENINHLRGETFPPIDPNPVLSLAIERREALISTARGVLGDSTLAEDAYQDTLVRLLETPPNGGISNQAAYLGRAIRNRAIRIARNRSREIPCGLCPDDARQALPPDDPGEWGATPLERVILRRLARGANCRQIALSLGLSNRQVQTRLARVRERNNRPSTGR